MQLIRAVALAAFLGTCLCAAIPAAYAQVSIGISVNLAPPPLPVYEQPPIPAPGYFWTPGYWAWNEEIGDYYWVPGTWILPPESGLLWTPGYWAWNDGAYVFYDGYWGPEIGFYGGVNYGFGYTGFGYDGGYWRSGAFFYNTSVNNISDTTITNVYNRAVVVNNTSNASYNGGAGGTTARPTVQQVAIAKARHLPPTQEQTRHVQTAARDPALSLTQSQGHPAVAATARPAQFRGPGVVAAHPGTPVLPAKLGSPSNAATRSNDPMPSRGGPSHALPGFTPQLGGKPAVTSRAPSGTGASSAAMSLARRGPGGDKELPSLGAKPSTPDTATPHPTPPPPVVHHAMPAAPAFHQTPPPPSPFVHQAMPAPAFHQAPPPPPIVHQAMPAPAFHQAPPPPIVHQAMPVPPAFHQAPPPRPPAAAKPKCGPGQPCR